MSGVVIDPYSFEDTPSPAVKTVGLWKFNGDITNEVSGGPSATEEGAGYAFNTIDGYQGIQGLDATVNDYVSVPCELSDADFHAGKSMTIELWQCFSLDHGVGGGNLYCFQSMPDQAITDPQGGNIFQLYAGSNANFYMRGYTVTPYSLWASHFNTGDIEVWRHMAWVFNGASEVASTWINGVLGRSDNLSADVIRDTVRAYLSERTGVTRDLRVSNIARYTEAFTPETNLVVD